MATDTIITVWQKHKQWSVTADRIKDKINGARAVVLILGSCGAVLETLSTQVHYYNTQKFYAWLGAAFLGFIPLIYYRILTKENTQAWIRTRSASEGLKKEVYSFAAKAAPYDNANAENALRERAMKIENDIQDLAIHMKSIEAFNAVPPNIITSEDYINKRVSEQIDKYYLPKFRKYVKQGNCFRVAEFCLAFAAVLLAAATGVWGKNIPIGPWVAVLTTISGALTSHIIASRFDFLATNYLATARRLEDLRGQWKINRIDRIPSCEWSEFVGKCEAAISVENEAWMVKQMKEEKGVGSAVAG
jgi:hypothetical protein